ncbi:hypothetical protein SDC9_185559 [bioreactor metagenome]|uniref:Uncharacterized protein n=1 Tax=bioreactor metagenome TaxID=1076179 RepID=A0A645HHH5_9ZZZZ
MMDANTAVKISAIWEGPEVTSSPNILTPANIIAIRTTTGVREIIKLGFFIGFIFRSGLHFQKPG